MATVNKMERKLTREDFMRKSFRTPKPSASPEVPEPMNGAPPPSPVSLSMLGRTPQPQYHNTAARVAFTKVQPIQLRSFEPPDEAAPTAPSDDVLRNLERQIGEMEKGLERAQNGTATVHERARYGEYENLLRTGVSSVGGGGYLAADSDNEHDSQQFSRNESTRSSTGAAAAPPRTARLARTNSDTQQHAVAATARMLRKLADNGREDKVKVTRKAFKSFKNSVVGNKQDRVLAEHKSPVAATVASPVAPAPRKSSIQVMSMWSSCGVLQHTSLWTFWLSPSESSSFVYFVCLILK